MELLAQYRRWIYALLVLLVLLAGLTLLGWVYGVLQACGSILALYFTAWLLQFFFTPVVDFMTRHHIHRLVAVIYVYLVLALVVVIAGLAFVPPIYNNAQMLARQLGNPATYEAITKATQGIEKALEQHGVPQKDIKQFTHDYSFSLRTGALQLGTKLKAIMLNRLTASNLSSSATTFLGFLNTISTLLLNAVIVLLLAFYMTLDGHRLAHSALRYVPPPLATVLQNVFVIVNRKFGGYLRGQLILAVCYGVLTFLITWVFGLTYGLFIAVFAAVMMLIPFVGSYAAIVPPILGFILRHIPDASFPVGSFVLLLFLLILSQQLVINILAPRVMGSAIGMHPILVVLGLLLGVKVAGLWGAIFGVPVFAVIVDTADLLYRRVMEQRFGFRPPDADEPPAGTGARRAPADSPADEPEAEAPDYSKAGVALHGSPPARKT